MYTDEEKNTAAALLNNNEYVELIAKVFLESEDKINSDVVLAKTNEELGEIVRANDLAEQKVKSRFNTLKMLARPKNSKPNPAAKS